MQRNKWSKYQNLTSSEIIKVQSECLRNLVFNAHVTKGINGIIFCDAINVLILYNFEICLSCVENSEMVQNQPSNNNITSPPS